MQFTRSCVKILYSLPFGPLEREQNPAKTESLSSFIKGNFIVQLLSLSFCFSNALTIKFEFDALGYEKKYQ